MEGFAAEFGPQFYGLKPNKGKIVLERADNEVPETLDVMGTKIVPFHGGETLRWKFSGLVYEKSSLKTKLKKDPKSV